MTLAQSKQWLHDNGFVPTGYTMSMFGPHSITYTHPDGRRASLDDEEEGELSVDGVPPFRQADALRLFTSIIENNT